VIGSGELIRTPASNRSDLMYIPSTWSDMLAGSSRETPAVTVSEYGFSSSSERMPMFGGALEAKDSGSRPPYGSGYEGFRMLMLNCENAPVSLPGRPFMIALNWRPAPKRATVRPSLATSQTRPRRGDQLLVSPREAKST
jgi:hypothetical protein